MTGNSHQKISDNSFGIGGILRFYICDRFTAGIYGGTQKADYKSANSDNSYVNIGYGGPFIGISSKRDKIRYSVSAFAGMGTIRNLHIESQNGSELIESYLYQNPVFLLSPIISIDYLITQKISATAQSVLLTGRVNGRSFYNPIIQIGILFSR